MSTSWAGSVSGVLCRYLHKEGESACLYLVSVLVSQPVLLYSVIWWFVLSATLSANHQLLLLLLLFIEGFLVSRNVEFKRFGKDFPSLHHQFLFVSSVFLCILFGCFVRGYGYLISLSVICLVFFFLFFFGGVLDFHVLCSFNTHTSNLKQSTFTPQRHQIYT